MTHASLPSAPENFEWDTAFNVETGQLILNLVEIQTMFVTKPGNFWNKHEPVLKTEESRVVLSTHSWQIAEGTALTPTSQLVEPPTDAEITAAGQLLLMTRPKARIKSVELNARVQEILNT